MFSPGEIGETPSFEKPESGGSGQKTKKRKSPDVGAYMSPQVRKEIEESDAQRIAELKEKLAKKSAKEKGGENKT